MDQYIGLHLIPLAILIAYGCAEGKKQVASSAQQRVSMDLANTEHLLLAPAGLIDVSLQQRDEILTNEFWASAGNLDSLMQTSA